FLTSRYGYPELGAIGSKPLGELIFQSELFVKQSCKFAKFTFNKKDAVWGRRTNYLVNEYPFSIMEVFL
ncbi:chorismate lyase, partial [Gammaproteobacteria bacterium]|nr:chorismate lyase [Gammaproteobacteria bacterium]